MARTSSPQAAPHPNRTRLYGRYTPAVTRQPFIGSTTAGQRHAHHPRPTPIRTRLHSHQASFATHQYDHNRSRLDPHSTPAPPACGIGPVVSDMYSLVPPERAPVLSFSSWERPCEPTCVLSCLRNGHLSTPVSSLEHSSSSIGHLSSRVSSSCFLVLVISRIEMCLRGLLGPSAAPVGAQVCQPSHHRGRRRRVQLGRRD